MLLAATAGWLVWAPQASAAVKPVKCAIVQYTVQEPDAVGVDAERVAGFVREAALDGARLVVCPESTFYRYQPWSQNNVTILQLAGEAETLKAKFSALAKELGICLVIGLREPSGDAAKVVFNSALFFGPDGALLGRHRKVALADEEYDFTKAGEEKAGDGTPFATPYGRVGMLIGKDMATTFWADILAAKGMDLLIGISADPERGWQGVVHGCVKAHCQGIGANLFGTAPGATFAGKSGFVSPAGACLVDGGGGEKIIYGTLKLPVTGAK